MSSNYEILPLQTTFLYFQALLHFSVGALSFASNVFLIFVTARNKKELRNTCAYLLSLTAACDCVVASSTLPTLALTVLGLRKSGTWCFWANSPANAALAATFVLVLLIALDRLFATLMPFAHRELPKGRYVGVLSALSVAFGVALLSLLYPYWADFCNGLYPMFKCILSDVWRDNYIWAMHYSCIGCSLGAVLCYALILARFKLFGLQNEHATRALLKSLVVQTAVITVGWVGGMSLRNWINNSLFKPTFGWFMVIAVPETLITFNGGLTALVLYTCSSEYRQCMRAEWQRLLGRQTSTTTNRVHHHVARTQTTNRAGIARQNREVAPPRWSDQQQHPQIVPVDGHQQMENRIR